MLQSDSSYSAFSEQVNFSVVSDQAQRGDILAEDGRILVSSVPYYRIYLDTQCSVDSVWNNGIDELSKGLAEILGTKSAAQWKRDLTNARKENMRYYRITGKVDYQTKNQLKSLPIFKLPKYRGGFIAEMDERRTQLNGNLASRTLGFVNSDGSAMVGIEGAYNDYLKGSDGKVVRQKLTGGDWITIDSDNNIPSVNGDDVQTTIDIDLQDVANNALMNQLSTHGADHGCAIVMEVATGDIKAIANLSRTANGDYTEDYNYAIGESVEPGSTLKLASIMAVLDHNKKDTADIIETGNGAERVGNIRIIRDSHTGGFGTLTVKQVFEKSSNIGTSKIVYESYRSDPEMFVAKLDSFGLSRKLGIELSGEGSPLIRHPGDNGWSRQSLLQMSYGYEVALTPLQILTFYNGVANNGKVMKPRFVSSIKRNGEIIEEFPPVVLNEQLASERTIKIAKELMEGVVENGTGTNLKTADYKIAGKTGTAQIANNNLGYRTGARMAYRASFVGYFPADNPMYSCFVVVSNPTSGVYYGNVVAGDVFREITDKIYASSFYKELPINEDRNEDNETTDSRVMYHSNTTIEQLAVANIGDSIPDVKGMSLRDALYLLESSGYVVEHSGKGKVIRQSPAAGTKNYKGKITINLRTS